MCGVGMVIMCDIGVLLGRWGALPSRVLVSGLVRLRNVCCVSLLYVPYCVGCWVGVF